MKYLAIAIFYSVVQRCYLTKTKSVFGKTLLTVQNFGNFKLILFIHSAFCECWHVKFKRLAKNIWLKGITGMTKMNTYVQILETIFFFSLIRWDFERLFFYFKNCYLTYSFKNFLSCRINLNFISWCWDLIWVI